MMDIWEFLLQTLYVSLVGGVLLVIKRLLQDKLTPRWQYGVWSVLALRILLPVQIVGKYVLLPLPLWVETLRILTEQVISALWILWLYRLYLAGVLLVLAWYFLSYLRLRLLIRKGERAGEEIEQQIDRVAEQYGLPRCRAVTLTGLPSPMVCGLVCPILILPGDMPLDDPVLLHELLHVKHRDAVQNVFWAVCRALHWCNPFVHYLMNRIGNDMESLCDQRVLERLEGEERRDYGLSLLAMANDRYPRAPGTTSISNGGRNIARRIEAIVRFKKYPAGMALASVCVTIMLASACLFPVSAQGIKGAGEGAGPWERARAEASINLARCTTAAGAIDTYAKGLIEGNLDYLALASKATEEDDFVRTVQIYDYNYDLDERYFDTGETTEISLAEHGENYAIHNLRPLPDGTMAAELVILLDDIWDDPVLTAIEGSEENPSATGAVQMSIRLTEAEDWRVEETGSYILYVAGLAKSNATGMWFGLEPYKPGRFFQAVGESGTVTKETLTEHCIQTQTDPLGLFGVQSAYSSIPDPNAEFSYVQEASTVTYIFEGTQEEKDALNTVILQTSQMEKGDRKPYFIDSFAFGEGGWGSEFGNHRGSYTSEAVGAGWDGVVQMGGHASFEFKDYPDHGGGVQIRWNGEVVDEMILEEVTPDG